MQLIGRRVAAAATVAALVVTMAAGCGGTALTDKAGGSGGSEARVLRLVQPFQTEPPAQLAVWAKTVEARSGGTVRIEFLNGWPVGEASFEQRTIDDVKAGKIDGAWVGARVFDTIGVNSFQALLAPLLVDSHDLQGKVFQAGLPEQMMTGLDKIDLVGLGVLPGPMRKILGVSKPYAAPGDFKGATVGIQASGVATKTFQTLGATVRAVPGGRSLGGLDAYEQQMSSIARNQFAATAKYVTGNVNFWPRPLVLFTSHKIAGSLKPEQLSLLREAAISAMPDALDASRTEDERAVKPLCAAGMKLPAASEDDLTALRKALDPVYTELSTDPETASRIATIEQLKAELGTAPDFAACEESGKAKLNNDLAGEYRWTLTREDALKHGTDEDKTRAALETNYPNTFTTKLENSRWSMTQSADSELDTGAYEVFRDRVVFDWDTGPKLTFSYIANRHGDLTLKPIQPMEAGDAFVWCTKKWVRQ
jgi:TRAP-type transport system periplasmic protein